MVGRYTGEKVGSYGSNNFELPWSESFHYLTTTLCNCYANLLELLSPSTTTCSQSQGWTPFKNRWASYNVQISQIRSGETNDETVESGHNLPLKQPVGQPLYITPKKMQVEWCSRGDYHALNAAMKPNRNPTPFLPDVLASLGGKTIFSRLDLERTH